MGIASLPIKKQKCTISYLPKYFVWRKVAKESHQLFVKFIDSVFTLCKA